MLEEGQPHLLKDAPVLLQRGAARQPSAPTGSGRQQTHLQPGSLPVRLPGWKTEGRPERRRGGATPPPLSSGPPPTCLCDHEAADVRLLPGDADAGDEREDVALVHGQDGLGTGDGGRGRHSSEE